MIQSAEEFVRLHFSLDPLEYARASNDAAPSEVWRLIIEHYPDLRSWVAHNKTVPVAILEQLAGDPDATVRATVAGKRKLPTTLMAALAADGDASVRARIANNAKCGLEILRQLASDPEEFVRLAAATKLRARGTPG